MIPEGSVHFIKTSLVADGLQGQVETHPATLAGAPYEESVMPGARAVNSMRSEGDVREKAKTSPVIQPSEGARPSVEENRQLQHLLEKALVNSVRVEQRGGHDQGSSDQGSTAVIDGPSKSSDDTKLPGLNKDAGESFKRLQLPEATGVVTDLGVA